jgi:predicted aldo/keto reductase-like oxidoreductase
MRYNKLGATELNVSEVGLGCEHLENKEEKVVSDVVGEAIDQGINILDVFMPEPNVRTYIGNALKGRRDKVILQGHIGATWQNGQYCRTRDADLNKTYFEDFLTRLQTDYVDIGMLHFIDTMEDWETVLHGPVMEYVRKLKENGIIRAVGMSSHNASVSLEAVKSGLIDVLMFSLNPAFDLLPESADLDSLFKKDSYQQEGLLGMNPVRETLYRTCEAKGVGITVMKGFGAGSLLHEESSPFHVALTPSQLLQYALTRPAVGSVLVGCRTPDEVQKAVVFETATAQEKDYSAILGATKVYAMTGRCMYCNHCLPCPQNIDIAQVNKYFDLAAVQESVPATIRGHYEALAVHAGDCISCGQCEERCPFAVPVVKRMADVQALFGK